MKIFLSDALHSFSLMIECVSIFSDLSNFNNCTFSRDSLANSRYQIMYKEELYLPDFTATALLIITQNHQSSIQTLSTKPFMIQKPSNFHSFIHFIH